MSCFNVARELMLFFFSQNIDNLMFLDCVSLHYLKDKICLSSNVN